MRFLTIIVLVLVVCLIFPGFSNTDRPERDYFGFRKSEFTVVYEEDTHGGFLGDGCYYLVLDCSENISRAHEIIKDWKELPLSEYLELIMYGGVKNGMHYGYNYAEEAHWPEISSGVYKFVDRHDDAVDQSDEQEFFSRYSCNFSIAVYDLDKEMFCFFALDT